MNIVFLGGLFPPDRQQEFINNSNGCIQNAAKKICLGEEKLCSSNERNDGDVK